MLFLLLKTQKLANAVGGHVPFGRKKYHFMLLIPLTLHVAINFLYKLHNYNN